MVVVVEVVVVVVVVMAVVAAAVAAAAAAVVIVVVVVVVVVVTVVVVTVVVVVAVVRMKEPQRAEPKHGEKPTHAWSTFHSNLAHRGWPGTHYTHRAPSWAYTIFFWIWV